MALCNTKCVTIPAGNSTSSRLEDLPAELRLLILSSMPDLLTLCALVHASPVMHAQYRYSRDTILRACMSRELAGFLVDAYATANSRVRIIGDKRPDEKIVEYLSTYETWLSRSTAILDMKTWSPSCIRWVAAFHLSVAQPLARRYSEWALANLRGAVSSTEMNEAAQREAETDPAIQGKLAVELSRSEEIRVFRALYRYQTFQHLFGRNRGQRQGGFCDHEIFDLFFCLFEPWEGEAVGCIYLFVRSNYDDIFDQVKLDLHPYNPKFRQENGVFNPTGSYDLEGEYVDYMDGTISRGLKKTVRLLTINDHDELVQQMVRCLSHSAEIDAHMYEVLGDVSQMCRRDESSKYPNSRDEAEQRRDILQFAGDAVPPDGPPVAWVQLWGGKYSNIYGDYVPESVRRWGYVMWDERRWIDMKSGKSLITSQWTADLATEIETFYNWKPEGC
ncbi:hypothetical protein F4808DRAFT_455447 [Astrocystis sublimbata]|nr:hypothetical protein F4808DRAFT_455447 [Astrocystis sublimbata]